MKIYQLPASERASRRLTQAADLAWEYMGNSIYFRNQQGKSIVGCVPQVSLEEAQRRASIGEQILTLLENTEKSLLSHNDVLTYSLLEYYASNWRKDADRYWLAYDMSGIMFYGPFAQTAYTGGFLFNFISQALSAFKFTNKSDADNYLGLLSDVARMLRQIHARTQGQAERGIRIHKPQIAAVRDLLQGLKTGAEKSYCVDPSRLQKLDDAPSLAQAITARIVEEVLPAYDALIAQLDDDYERLAPDGVGMDKLPGGKAIYLDLLKMHTTLDLTAEQVHQAGLDRMARIHKEMAEIRRRCTFPARLRNLMCTCVSNRGRWPAVPRISARRCVATKTGWKHASMSISRNVRPKTTMWLGSMLPSNPV